MLWCVLACMLFLLARVAAADATPAVLDLLAAGTGSVGLIQEPRAGGGLWQETR